MCTITKKELIDQICSLTGRKRNDVKEVVQVFLEQIIEKVGDGHRIEFRDFGVFEVKQRAPRTAQNPKTLVRVKVPQRRTVKFKVGRLMRERLERPLKGLPGDDAVVLETVLVPKVPRASETAAQRSD